MDMAKKTLILAFEEKHFSFPNFFFTSDSPTLALKPKVEQNHGVHFFAHENYGGIYVQRRRHSSFFTILPTML